MKKLTVLLALAIFAVSLAAVAGEGKKGEKVVSGTISALDVANRSLTVTDAKNVGWTVLWNDSTRVKGGELKEGEAVELGYVEADSKMWASWIKVGKSTS
ncbi:MAG: hypothetical protein M3547_02440 [Acidobacteriota bacterium]|nr:hypothetical protein [Acidobacteriota bacterium]